MTKIGESFANVQFKQDSFLFNSGEMLASNNETQPSGLIEFSQSESAGSENESDNFLQEIMDTIDNILANAEDSDLPSFADTKPDGMAEAKQRWAEEQQKLRDSLPSFADTKPDGMAEAKQRWAEEQQKWRDSLPNFVDTRPQKPAQE